MAKNKKANGHSNGKSEFAKRNKSLLGYNSIFTPEVIDDIHIKAQLGRYRMRGMALMKKIPTFDDLVFFGICIPLILLPYALKVPNYHNSIIFFQKLFLSFL